MGTLAGPGEIVVSPEVRDRLVPGLDADIEDLGECYLKHLSAPVRAYRLGTSRGAQAVSAARAGPTALASLPTLAVIPFESRDASQTQLAIGELIAEGVIVQLSRSSMLNVISRLSSTVFRGRSVQPQQIETHLGATYILSGSYVHVGTRLTATAELADARTGTVMWSHRLSVSDEDLLQSDSELVGTIASSVHDQVLAREAHLSEVRALPTLSSASLLIGAVSLMHRATRTDFDRVPELLEHLIERSPRVPNPRAWMANWYVLRVTRGWSDRPAEEAKLALDQTRRALDADPQCSLALAVEGFVHCHMLKDLDAAGERYGRALQANPNDSLAWLFTSVLNAFKGNGAEAVDAAEQALRLSPLDPMRYFYDSLAATAALSVGQYERAIELARRSLRANRTHSSTLRALAISLAQLDRLDEARGVVASCCGWSRR